MATNAFYCPKCGAFKRHCEISSREFAALNGEYKFVQGLLTWGDVSGVNKVFSTVTGSRFWKCMSCGLASARNAAGEITNTAENS